MYGYNSPDSCTFNLDFTNLNRINYNFPFVSNKREGKRRGGACECCLLIVFEWGGRRRSERM